MTIFLREIVRCPELSCVWINIINLILYNVYSVCFEFHINTLIVFEAVSLRYEVLCHCEKQRDVAISRKGYKIAYKYGLFIKLSKGHSCYIITSAIIKIIV